MGCFRLSVPHLQSTFSVFIIQLRINLPEHFKGYFKLFLHDTDPVCRLLVCAKFVFENLSIVDSRDFTFDPRDLSIRMLPLYLLKVDQKKYPLRAVHYLNFPRQARYRD